MTTKAKGAWYWAKWIALAIVSAAGVILAWVYGKRTPAVARAKVRSIEAKEAVLAHQKDIALKEAERASSEEVGEQKKKEADTLTVQLDEVRKAKARAMTETGDLPSADDLANLENDRRAARSGSSAG